MNKGATVGRKSSDTREKTWRTSASTRSGCFRSTRSSKRTPDIPACRWARRRWLISSGRVTSDTIRRIRTGPTATASSSRPATRVRSDLADQFEHALEGRLPAECEAHLPIVTSADCAMATRDATRTVINALAGIVTNLVGGSADLDPSTRTAMKGCGDFESPLVDQHSEEVPTQGMAGGVWGVAGRVALLHTEGPVGIVLTRQKLPVPDRTLLASASGLLQGAYVLVDAPNGLPPDLILIAMGSEVSLALEAHARLTDDAIRCRVVSIPCWELFDAQPQFCCNTILPPTVRAHVGASVIEPYFVLNFEASEPGVQACSREASVHASCFWRAACKTTNRRT
jgi:transketolase